LAIALVARENVARSSWSSAAGPSVYAILGRLCRQPPRPALEIKEIQDMNKGDRPGTKDDGRKLLGIELPFGWCLVKGQRLRAMQKELHEIKQTAGIRLRMCGQLLK
jgi:hypothetical protein